MFAFVIFGIPNWHKDVEIDQPVAVELVDNISDTATTNKPPAKVKPVEKPTPEPPKKQEKKNTDHQQEKVEKEFSRSRIYDIKKFRNHIYFILNFFFQ